MSITVRSNLWIFLLNALFLSLRQSGCRQFHNLVPNAEKDLSFICDLDFSTLFQIYIFSVKTFRICCELIKRTRIVSSSKTDLSVLKKLGQKRLSKLQAMHWTILQIRFESQRWLYISLSLSRRNAWVPPWVICFILLCIIVYHFLSFQTKHIRYKRSIYCCRTAGQW